MTSQAAIGPSTTVEAAAAVPIAEAWRGFVPVDLALVFPAPKGPIPAVVGTEDQTGPWDEPGQSRVIVLSDGSRVREEITLSEPSGGAAPANGRARFHYRVSGFTGSLGALTGEAEGRWLFEEVDGSTRITWTYAFRPTTILARPFLSLLIMTYWRRYMASGLSNVVQLLEKQGTA